MFVGSLQGRTLILNARTCYVLSKSGDGLQKNTKRKGGAEVGINGDDEGGVLCDVRYRFLRRADLSSRAILPSVIKLKNIVYYVEIKCQIDATEVFIADLFACSTCFGHHYAHHQELKSIIQWLLPVVFCAVVFQVAGLVWS